VPKDLAKLGRLLLRLTRRGPAAAEPAAAAVPTETSGVSGGGGAA
jgi:hypothetical protein